MSYILRKAIKNDLPKLIDLCKQHAAYEQADYHERGKQSLLEKAIFSKPQICHCLVIEYQNTLVGYATYLQQFSTWDGAYYIYMDCLFVEEEHRSKGLGNLLIERIKADGKSLGCSHIQWQTPTFNTRAMKFYDRIGGTSKSKERYFLPI